MEGRSYPDQCEEHDSLRRVMTFNEVKVCLPQAADFQWTVRCKISSTYWKFLWEYFEVPLDIKAVIRDSKMQQPKLEDMAEFEDFTWVRLIELH